MRITIDKVTYETDDELSGRDFTGWDFNDRPEYDFSNKVIYASVFSNETPRSLIFPSKTSGVTFLHCNLDNVELPDASVAVNCSTKSFEVQNDLRDWEIEPLTDVPIKVLNEKYWVSKGISVDPADIPAQKVEVPEGKNLEDVLTKAEVVAEVAEVSIK